jgi:dienelactone hydrolase
VRWETVDIPEVGLVRLAVARPPGPGPFPSVIILHGSHGFAREYVELADELARDGMLAIAACWFSGGHGAGRLLVTPLACPDGTPARPMASSDQALRTVDALVRAVRARPDSRDDQIALFGHSRGGGVVVNYLLRGGSAQVGIVNSAGYPAELGPMVPRLSAALLLFHGNADSPADGGSEYTNVRMARAFEAALRAERKRVDAVYYPSGTHGSFFTSRDQHQDEVRRMLRFLRAEFRLDAASER